jgi:hypothetical protein
MSPNQNNSDSAWTGVLRNPMAPAIAAVCTKRAQNLAAMQKEWLEMLEHARRGWAAHLEAEAKLGSPRPFPMLLEGVAKGGGGWSEVHECVYDDRRERKRAWRLLRRPHNRLVVGLITARSVVRTHRTTASDSIFAGASSFYHCGCFCQPLHSRQRSEKTAAELAATAL